MFPRRQLAVARFKLVEVKTSFERENEECEMAHERIIFVPLMVKAEEKVFLETENLLCSFMAQKLCLDLDRIINCVSRLHSIIERLAEGDVEDKLIGSFFSAVVELLQLILYRLGNFPKVS
jgi:hypothetical protein